MTQNFETFLAFVVRIVIAKERKGGNLNKTTALRLSKLSLWKRNICFIANRGVFARKNTVLLFHNKTLDKLYKSSKLPQGGWEIHHGKFHESHAFSFIFISCFLPICFVSRLK